jgi:hypothetical protein
VTHSDSFYFSCSCLDVAVLRDVNDYVIIEKWRDVEQALIGNTQICSIWNAWGAAKNEVNTKIITNYVNVQYWISSTI